MAAHQHSTASTSPRPVCRQYKLLEAVEEVLNDRDDDDEDKLSLLMIQILTRRRQNRTSMTLRYESCYAMTAIAASSQVHALQTVLGPTRQLVTPCLALAHIHH